MKVKSYVRASRKYSQAKATVPKSYEREFSELLESMGISYTTEKVYNGIEFIYGIYIGSKESKKIDMFLNSIYEVKGSDCSMRKFKVNAAKSEDFYTRDFPDVPAGKVKVAPQRGNYTVFIGLSDGTIAYQWCSTKEKAKREAEYARSIIKKYGSDDSYWTEQGYKIWNPNVESKKSVKCSRPAKCRFTITAASKTDLTRKLSKLYNDYMAIDDDRALKKTGMTLAEYNALPDVFERLQKNGHVNTFMTGLANYFKKFGFSVSLDGTDYEITASRSTKRRFSVKASTDKSKTIEVHFNDGRKPAKYTASVLEDMMTESNVDYIIDAETGELIYESEHGDVRSAVKCSALDDARDNREELSGTYYIVYNGDIIVETDGTGDAGEDALAEVFTMDADALAAAVEYLNSFGDDLIEEDEVSDAGEVARVLSQFIQMEYDEGQMDPTYFGSEIYWVGGRIEWFDAADLAESNNIDEWIENTDLSAEDLDLDIDIDSAQAVECGDAIADRFMVDLMYQKNGGYAEDRYFDDWSEVEAYAHDGLMRGFYARIWDKETGETITISPDEYAEAWENGAADFDINEEIVNFKNRVVTSSTKIEAFRDDTVDETAVRELVLVITNDGDLYRQRTTPIIENLKKKAAKGTYDREKAVKLWQYLADDGVRMYDKEYGSGRGSVAMLNPATRKAIAEELRDYYEEEIMWDINHADDSDDSIVTV